MWMRAVRAALAARLARDLLFLPDFFVLEAELFLVPDVVPVPGFVETSAEISPIAGDTAINTASAPATHRAGLGTRVGESFALMYPL